MKNLCTHASGHISPATVPVTLNSKNRKTFSRKPNNILVILLSVSLLLLSQFSTAQAPQQFSFQGVARDATGKILVNKNIALELVIHEGSANGPQVFSELHNTSTNPNGIFNLQIGSINSLDNINWESSSYFLQMAIAYDGQPNVSLGTTQLLSVPYSLHATSSLESKKWTNDEPVIQTGSSNTGSLLPDVSVGNTLIWYPKMAAFRAGRNNGNWNRNTIGEYSFATGNGTLASGESSASFGVSAKATGNVSFAVGNLAEATGVGSIALGSGSIASGLTSISAGTNAQAIGQNAIALGSGSEASGVGSLALGNSTAIGLGSFSLGEGVEVKAAHGIAMGKFNNNGDSPDGIIPNATDRLFQLGNGSTNASRSNAITVLRNGNIGIGNNVLNPAFVLDVGARARIRHNSGGFTAGIYFDDSQNSAQGFVGMVNDDEVGLFVGSAWRLVVNKSGTVYAQKFQQFSDRRLKTNIKPVQNSMANLRAIQGYNYHWKSPKDDQGLQTGVIAQELEEKFPELVTTNKDGYKSVNYIGLIPHLIEAVKELDKRTDEITRLKKELAEVREINKRMTTLEAELKSLLTGNTSAIGKSHAK